MFRTWVLTVFTDTDSSGDHAGASSLFGSNVVRIGHARSAGRLPRRLPRTSRRRHSPFGFRPASPLSTARESPGSGDDLSPAWGRAWACREGSHGRQGTCAEIPGRYRDL